MPLWPYSKFTLIPSQVLAEYTSLNADEFPATLNAKNASSANRAKQTSAAKSVPRKAKA